MSMGIHDRSYYREDDFAAGLAPSWNQKSAVATIIIACVAVFLAEILLFSRSFSLQTFLSLSTSDLERPWMLWRALTYGFTHSTDNIGHILWNMLGLWFLGRIVENHYGRAEFFRAYLVAIVVSGLVSIIFRAATGQPTIVCGASGAVSFVTMLFVLNYPNQTVYIFGVLPIQAWVMGVLLIASNLYGSGSGVLVGGQSQIAWDVHLVGIGLAFAYFYLNWNLAFLAEPLQYWKSFRRKWLGPKLQAFRPSEDVSSDEAEADRILDKIHQLGKDSLTSKEQKFLTKYSQQVRKRRNESP
ncbi:MAG: rhomboid family intramembrane serine protease [Planctomycetota bacterium]|nr:rhomboid family intramembrane serine protease [Planctomycetota bacterium]